MALAYQTQQKLGNHARRENIDKDLIDIVCKTCTYNIIEEKMGLALLITNFQKYRGIDIGRTKSFPLSNSLS